MRKQPAPAPRSRRTPAGAGACCPPRSALRDRPLLSAADAGRVAALFKVLANDTRIRLLHHLVRTGEATVTELAKAVGMKPQAVSNQLVRLADTGMLASRRDGNHIYYRVVNGCVPPLLDLALCLMEDEGRTGGCHV
jgi:ArsR family transcriptional regulator, lead/cadmium/zinc/bismuth-responsive transcriptional repressor